MPFLSSPFARNPLKVSVAAGLLRSALLQEVGLASVCSSPALASELNAFLSSRDDGGVAAGRYLFFSPSFLLSFYGILATYVAIMVQSF